MIMYTRCRILALALVSVLVFGGFTTAYTKASIVDITPTDPCEAYREVQKFFDAERQLQNAGRKSGIIDPVAQTVLILTNAQHSMITPYWLGIFPQFGTLQLASTVELKQLLHNAGFKLISRTTDGWLYQTPDKDPCLPPEGGAPAGQPVPEVQATTISETDMNALVVAAVTAYEAELTIVGQTHAPNLGLTPNISPGAGIGLLLLLPIGVAILLLLSLTRRHARKRG